LNLAGGPSSSVFLIVAYPDSFGRPTIKMPTLPTPNFGGRKVKTGSSGVPANVTLTQTTDTTEVSPMEFVPEDWNGALGLDSGWTAWAIPANPSERGFSAWVFNLPLQSEIQYFSKAQDPPEEAPTHFDKYFQVLGVGVVSNKGSLLGFAPLPPQIAWSAPSTL
jgi:hypothetical protein